MHNITGNTGNPPASFPSKPLKPSSNLNFQSTRSGTFNTVGKSIDSASLRTKKHSMIASASIR